ncbi:MAG: PAS domain S-box protein [Firmicutes bacterium]|nr:PAS domain S-box protein [Bacillota bacterium]
MVDRADLETRFYIDLANGEQSAILSVFKAASVTQLPVVTNGEYLGLLDLFSFIESGSASGDLIIRDTEVASSTDDLLKYCELEQQVLPVLDYNRKYLGYVDVACLRQRNEVSRVRAKLAKEIQYYKDLKEEFDAIFKSSHDGIFIADGGGTVIRINQASERIDEVRADEVLGNNMRELVAKGFYSESVTLKVLESKTPTTILQRTKTGKEIMASGTPIFKEGKLYRVVVNSRDITELVKLKNALREEQLRTEKIESELNFLRQEHLRTDEIIWRSPEMERVFELALRVARVDSTVLIEGESGVGKEVVSKFIHLNSARKGQPFIKIDCSGIPENLLESELFGYEQGAFTGASSTGKLGLFELANQGTLFLDEIGELPFNLQAKLLRALQDREITRIGGTAQIPIDIRIIAATNRQLGQMVVENQFRKDLYYRLNVVPVLIPPLRMRRPDIQPLITYFTKKYNTKFCFKKSFNPQALDYLLAYEWPGNVRELENMIERLLVTVHADVIKVEDLPHSVTGKLASSELVLIDLDTDFRHNADRFEQKLLEMTMAKSSNTFEMARRLGLDVSTVRRKMKKYDLKYM